MPTQREWYVWSGDKALGPLTVSELESMASQGRVSGSDLYRRGIDGVWQSATRIPELAVVVRQRAAGRNSKRNTAVPAAIVPVESGVPDSLIPSFETRRKLG